MLSNKFKAELDFPKSVRIMTEIGNEYAMFKSCEGELGSTALTPCQVMTNCDKL